MHGFKPRVMIMSSFLNDCHWPRPFRLLPFNNPISVLFLVQALQKQGETNSSDVTWQIPRSHVHQSPPLVPVLRQTNPAHAWHFTSWALILMLSSHLRLCVEGVPLPQVSPAKLCMHLCSPSKCYTPHQSPSSWLDHPNSAWRGMQTMTLLIT